MRSCEAPNREDHSVANGLQTVNGPFLLFLSFLTSRSMRVTVWCDFVLELVISLCGFLLAILFAFRDCWLESSGIRLGTEPFVKRFAGLASDKFACE